MSKNVRKPRAKSGNLMRPLGGVQLSYGVAPRAVVPTCNDPALQVNQMQTPKTPSSVSPVPKDTEREFKMLQDCYRSSQQSIKDLTKSQKKLEVKELKMKDTINQLEKLISELRYEVKTKTEVLEALKKTLDTKTKEHEEKLANKEHECNDLRSQLESSQAETASKQKKISEIIRDYEKKAASMKEEHERQIKLLREEKDAKIKEKEGRLELLKRRMAETIGRNSSERQHQLDDLKKDLIKASQEAKELHKQLHHIQTNPPKCRNCGRLEAMLDEKTLQVRLKDKTINDLQSIGKTMQLQLHQQDVILTKWEEREKNDTNFQ